MESRERAIAEVAACVCKNRSDQYGSPEDSFASIAALLNVVLRRKLAAPLSPLDVASIMACVKLARISNNEMYRDNWIDLAGYGVCGAAIQEILCESSSQEPAGSSATQ